MDRRKFLRAAGVSLALPALPSLTRAANAASADAIPTRMCYLYVPNGVNVKRWQPSIRGDSFELNESTAALASMRDQLSFIGNLAHQNGSPGSDGGGDHARASATFLTAARPYKTAGSDIRLGVSADQVVAQSIGHATRLKSLELSCDGVRKSGLCDSGYACAYQYNMAWSDAQTPVSPESNPRLVFERLFGSGSPGQRAKSLRLRQQGHKSMLDFLRDEVGQMNQSLGRDDQRKLDEYLTGLRDIEQRIEKTERYGMPPDPDFQTPAGIPDVYSEHISLMSDVLLLALECDVTRVATFMFAFDGSNRTFPEIGIGDGHHHLSHHKNNEARLDKIARIDAFYAHQFAYFLRQAASKKNPDGSSLLDHTMVCYGSGLSDGNRHSHENLPIITAGGSAVGWNGGRYVQPKKQTPMANLHLDMIRRMGVDADSFGDSTGVVSS